MKKKTAKIASVSLAGIMFTQSAFAMSDYKNIYKIDYMDEIFRFDTGEFLEGFEFEEEEKNPYEFYMAILKSFGVNLYDEAGKKTYASNAEYSDLYGAIASLISSDSDFIESYKSGKFEGNITMYEALSYMADMLGYTQIKEQVGVESIASEYDLLKGISYSKEKYITIGELAVMLWNTLNAEGVAAKITSDGVTYEEASEPLMERQLNIYEISGFLNAANGMNVYKNSSPNEGYVEIDRAGYLAGESNAAEYLGKRVTAFVQGEGNEEKTILYLTDEKNSENITLDTKEIYSVGDYLEYEIDTNLKKIDIRNLEYVLLNGNATNDISVIEDFENMDGEITLSKTEKNGEYNVAIINSYEYFVIYSVDTYERKIHLKDNAKFKGESYIEIPEDELVFCTLDGEKSTFENLYAGCSIKFIQNDNKSYTNIQASSDTVTGKISGIDSDTGIIKINGAEYRVSKTYENNSANSEIKTNLFGVFYVTKDKYIAGFKDGNEASYGYLRKIIIDEETEECLATVFNQMGKWETLTLKEKITLDGVTGIEAAAAVETIKMNKATDKIIRYKINGSNEITFIDTLTDEISEADDDKRLSLAYEGNVTQSWQGGKWFRSDMGYRILDSSPVFEVPSDVNKTADYKIKTGANLNDDEQNIFIKLYTADEIGICEAAVISEQADTLSNETTYWFYCEKVGTVWNEEEQQTDYIMTGTRMTSGKTAYSENFEVKVSAEKREKLEETYPGAIGKGTLMKLTYDADGYLSAAEVAFTNAKLPDEFWNKSNTSYYQYFCGTVTNIDTERGYIVVKAETYKKEFGVNQLICIDSSDYSSRMISIGDLLVGEKMYVYKAAGGGRICAIVR